MKRSLFLLWIVLLAWSAAPSARARTVVPKAVEPPEARGGEAVAPLSEVPAETPPEVREGDFAKTEREAFLKKRPDAERTVKKGPDGRTYTVLAAREPGQGARLGVFDEAGKGIYRAGGQTRFLPGEDLLLASLDVRRQGPGGKTRTRDILLAGFRNGAPVPLSLEFDRRSSHLTDYHYRTWLEDVDGDGGKEVCRFFRRRFQCLRWNSRRGQWDWLKEFEGRRVERTRPPVRWVARARRTEGRPTFDLALDVVSLVEKPLALSQPLPPLFRSGGNSRWSDVGPVAGHHSPAIVRAGDDERPWRVTPMEKLATTLVLAPGATETLRFRLDPPANAKDADAVALQIVLRARWRRFEVNCREAGLGVFLAPDAVRPAGPAEVEEAHFISGLLSQKEIDAAARYLVENKKRIPSELGSCISTNVRTWLVRRILAEKRGWSLLVRDLSDEAGRVALRGIRDHPTAKPETVSRLLLFALGKLDPEEYAEALEQAGARRASLAPALELALKYTGAYMDRKALAALLADWPDESLASQARKVLGAQEQPARE